MVLLNHTFSNLHQRKNNLYLLLSLLHFHNLREQHRLRCHLHSHTLIPQRSWHPRSPPVADEGPRLGPRAGKAESRCHRLQRYRCSSHRPAPGNLHCLSRKHQTLRPRYPAKRAAAAGPPSYGERPPPACSLRTPVARTAGRLQSYSQHASRAALTAPLIKRGWRSAARLWESGITYVSDVRGRDVPPDFPWIGPGRGELYLAASFGSSPGHLELSQWKVSTCHNFTAPLVLFHGFLFPFLVSAYI